MMPDYSCPCCGGYGVPLGTLGRLFYLRCRFCGADFSVPNPDFEEE